MVTCICQQCKQSFSHIQQQKFCSHACYSDSIRSEHVTYTCKTCGASKTVRPSKLRGGYCSYKCSVAGKVQDVHARFWTRVDVKGEDECWPWNHSRDPHGYGVFSLSSRNRPASRVAYLLAHGPIPDGHRINHHCDNPPCCNPKHLYAGTAADNTRDMMVRGRQKVKFTPDDVLFIRHSGLGPRFLAAMFDSRESHISSIKNGHIHKHVPS